MNDLLSELKAKNLERCESETGFDQPLNSWSPMEWAAAVAGETGEFCNAIKKKTRFELNGGQDGDDTVRLGDIGSEAADIVIYLDLACQRMGINLREEIIHKFNKTSRKINSGIRLTDLRDGFKDQNSF